MIYAQPGTQGALLQFKDKYDNFIGGKWLAPVGGQYFDLGNPQIIPFLFNLVDTHGVD
ncbi:hypothetical protein I6M39_20285 [Shewanella algae]|uniref:hypothetical protein n=1 Tax=Shewanella algae TaxID=38313 RepID=UPI001AACF629|nr:hypothetical protein [Shewanella algae]MBO2571309.1 hypothetical protein [Shewanella algae]